MPVSEETEGDVVTNYFKKKTKRLGLLAFLKSAQENILPQRLKKAFWETVSFVLWIKVGQLLPEKLT